jgi:hypothetical protein
MTVIFWQGPVKKEHYKTHLFQYSTARLKHCSVLQHLQNPPLSQHGVAVFLAPNNLLGSGGSRSPDGAISREFKSLTSGAFSQSPEAMASGARELKALEQQLKQTQLKQKAGIHEFLFPFTNPSDIYQKFAVGQVNIRRFELFLPFIADLILS